MPGFERLSTRALALGAALALAGVANAGLLAQFELADHPDASQAPPPYGLRLDNFFANSGGEGGVTTFSFNTEGGVRLSVFDETEFGDRTGSTLRINISGEVFGGESSGFGVGSYFLDFNYTMHVSPMDDGWVVTNADPNNSGTLTPVFGVEDGRGGGAEYLTFFDQNNEEEDASFQFLGDGHRLDSLDRGSLQLLVGRGWLTFNQDNTDSAGTQDFLFVGRIIPLPSAAGMGLVGLGLVVSRRRR